MCSPADSLRRWCRPLGLAFAIGLCLVPALTAQEVATDEARAEVVGQLESSFRVLELRQGWILEPLDDTVDASLVEVRPGRVSVDGRRVDFGDLERLFGTSEARRIQDLSDLATELETVEPVDGPPPAEAPAAGPEAGEVEPPLEQPDDLEAAERRAERAARRLERSLDRARARQDTQVSLGTALTVEEDEEVSEVVVIGNSLDVRGVVMGDAVVVLGSARISGRVDGTVTVVGGSLSLEGGRVDGDVVTVGGSVSRDGDTRIDGELVQLDFGQLLDHDFDFNLDLGDGRSDDLGWWEARRHSTFWNLLGRLFKIGLVAFLALGCLLIANRKVPEIGERVRQEPWKAGLVGLLTQVLFVPLLGLVCLVLLISVVGIPLLLVVPPLAVLVLVLFFLLGYAAVALIAGQWLRDRFDLAHANPFVLLLLGMVLIEGWSVLGQALTVTPPPIQLTAYVLLLAGFLIKYVAWTVGLGGAMLQQFSPPPPPALGAGELWSDEDTQPWIEPPPGPQPPDAGDPAPDADPPSR